MYPMMAIKQPISAKPTRCFSLSEMYASVRVVTDAAMKMGITND